MAVVIESMKPIPPELILGMERSSTPRGTCASPLCPFPPPFQSHPGPRPVWSLAPSSCLSRRGVSEVEAAPDI